jgi:hypothetical protein
MTAQSLTIRKKLHQFIDTVEEKKLKAMYVIFEEEIESEYSDEFKKMLDERYEKYKRTGVYVTEKEANRRINSLLRSKKK